MPCVLCACVCMYYTYLCWTCLWNTFLCEHSKHSRIKHASMCVSVFLCCGTNRREGEEEEDEEKNRDQEGEVKEEGIHQQQSNGWNLVFMRWSHVYIYTASPIVRCSFPTIQFVEQKKKKCGKEWLKENKYIWWNMSIEHGPTNANTLCMS